MLTQTENIPPANKNSGRDCCLLAVITHRHRCVCWNIKLWSLLGLVDVSSTTHTPLPSDHTVAERWRRPVGHHSSCHIPVKRLLSVWSPFIQARVGIFRWFQTTKRLETERYRKSFGTTVSRLTCFPLSSDVLCPNMKVRADRFKPDSSSYGLEEVPGM